jgi:hypothetical protein
MPVPRAAALPVREEQVRPRMALRELAADRPAAGPAAGPAAASRRDAGVVLFLAGPAVNASGAIQVIEPCRVHGAPPVTWIMRPLPIHLPFNRAQERGVPGLAYDQQLAHVRPVVPGPVVPGLVVPGLVVPGLVVPGLVVPGLVVPGLVVPGLVAPSPVVPIPVGPGLNVSAHKTSPAMTLPSAASTPVRVASRDDRTRTRLPASRQAPESGYRLAGMPGSGHPYQPAGRCRGIVDHCNPYEGRSDPRSGAGGAEARELRVPVDTAK